MDLGEWGAFSLYARSDLRVGLRRGQEPVRCRPPVALLRDQVSRHAIREQANCLLNPLDLIPPDLDAC
jgi:hypothetical protein